MLSYHMFEIWIHVYNFLVGKGQPSYIYYVYHNWHAARPAFRCGCVASYSKTVAPTCERIRGKSSARAWHRLKASITWSDSFHSFAHSCHLSYASALRRYTPTSRRKGSLNGAELFLFLQRTTSRVEAYWSGGGRGGGKETEMGAV